MTHFFPPASAQSPQPSPPHQPSSRSLGETEKRREGCHSPPVHGWMEERKGQPPVREVKKVLVSFCPSSPWAFRAHSYTILKRSAFHGVQGELYRRSPVTAQTRRQT